MKKDPVTMTAGELEEHIAALREDADEAETERAYLQTRQRMPGHQLERYEAEIERLKAKIDDAEALLAGLRSGGTSIFG
jgi:chromosome segregation ATPase